MMRRAKLLLDAGADLEYKNEDGVTPLRMAGNSNWDMAALLIQEGAYLDAPVSDNGWTLLMWAIAENNLEQVEFLLEHGASPDVKSDMGNDALLLADQKKEEFRYSGEVYDLISSVAFRKERYVNGETTFIQAAKNGDTKRVKILARQGANIEAKDDDGRTALIHAAIQQHVDTVSMPIELGVRVNKRDKEGKTALDYAAATGNDALPEILAVGKSEKKWWQIWK